MIRVGIIGYGYWGPNLVRNLSNQENGAVVAIADSRKDRLEMATRNYPKIKPFVSADDLINDAGVDAVVIATPVFTHFTLAKKALLAGKHVLIEKPMTASTAEALELIDCAQKNNISIMVDHTFLYTGAVQKMHELIKGGVIGKPMYFDSTRINLGIFQPDVNVLWDLAAHDIAILTYLIDELPYSINARGISHTKNGIENIAYMTVNYNSDFIAHFHCSWNAPVKVRQTLIGGDKKMILYNDLEPSEKVRIYDSGYEYRNEIEKNSILVDYRTGDVNIPFLSSVEALSGVTQDFLDSIETGSTPRSNAQLGMYVVSLLEAAQLSIKQNGKEIKLK